MSGSSMSASGKIARQSTPAARTGSTRSVWTPFVAMKISIPLAGWMKARLMGKKAAAVPSATYRVTRHRKSRRLRAARRKYGRKARRRRTARRLEDSALSMGALNALRGWQASGSHSQGARIRFQEKAAVPDNMRRYSGIFAHAGLQRAKASAIAGAARRAAKALEAQGEGGDEHLIHVDDGELVAIRG